jgi:hypothetical protein
VVDFEAVECPVLAAHEAERGDARAAGGVGHGSAAPGRAGIRSRRARSRIWSWRSRSSIGPAPQVRLGGCEHRMGFAVEHRLTG